MDTYMRTVKDALFAPLVQRMTAVSPLLLTLTAFFFGTATAVFLIVQLYWLALAAWLLNRVFDALDGGVARAANRQTDLGGYLDLTLDFVIYALIPVGLAWGRPSLSGAAALIALLAAFYVNGGSLFYLAAILEKRNVGGAARGEQTSVTMPESIVGGTMTFFFYTAFLLFPAHYIPLFWTMAALTVAAIGQRALWALQHLKES